MALSLTHSNVRPAKLTPRCCIQGLGRIFKLCRNYLTRKKLEIPWNPRRFSAHGLLIRGPTGAKIQARWTTTYK